MKKKILLALLTLVLMLSIVLTGCGGTSGVAQEKYDQVVAQLADAQSKLTKAQSDLSAIQSQKTTADAALQAAQAQVADLQKQIADLKAKYETAGLTKAQIAEKIVKDYKASHLYEKDIYDCNNMASDVWNMLKAQGISSVIVVGSIQYQITDILQSDHAWVLADVGTGEKLALDATIGQAFTQTANSRYFRGWSFTDPAALKANDDLRTEYNTRVKFINTLVTEINNAQTLYNNSSTQAEADKWLALYTKLKELKDAQEALATSVMNQILALATKL